MLKSSASRPTRRNDSLHGVLTDIPSCSARPPFPNGSCSEVQKAAARERQSHLCCELWRIQQESDCTWAPRIPSSPPPARPTQRCDVIPSGTLRFRPAWTARRRRSLEDVRLARRKDQRESFHFSCSLGYFDTFEPEIVPRRSFLFGMRLPAVKWT